MRAQSRVRGSAGAERYRISQDLAGSGPAGKPTPQIMSGPMMSSVTGRYGVVVVGIDAGR